MRVLLDTSVVLDVALRREPHFSESRDAMQWCEQGNAEATLVAYHTFSNVYYVLRRGLRDRHAGEGADSEAAAHAADEGARRFLKGLLSWAEVAPTSSSQVEDALDLTGDFEDCLQCFSARDGDADVILTRDKKGFRDCVVRAVTPAEFLAEVSAEGPESASSES